MFEFKYKSNPLFGLSVTGMVDADIEYRENCAIELYVQDRTLPFLTHFQPNPRLYVSTSLFKSTTPHAAYIPYGIPSFFFFLEVKQGNSKSQDDY